MKQYPVNHNPDDDEMVRESVADVVVEHAIIVELKFVRRIVVSDEVQLVNFLVAIGKPVGLVPDLREEKVEVKRKVRDLI